MREAMETASTYKKIIPLRVKWDIKEIEDIIQEQRHQG